MSILTRQQNDNITPAQRRARQILRSTSQTAQQLISGWERGFDALWQSEDPAAVLAELGTDAEEVFTLSGAVVQLLMTILPGRDDEALTRITSKIQAKPTTTTHDDGTVTIDT